MITKLLWEGQYTGFKYWLLTELQIHAESTVLAVNLIESSWNESILPSRSTATKTAIGALLVGGIVWFILEPTSLTGVVLPTLFKTPIPVIAAEAVRVAEGGSFVLTTIKEVVTVEQLENDLFLSQMSVLMDELKIAQTKDKCFHAINAVNRKIDNLDTSDTNMFEKLDDLVSHDFYRAKFSCADTELYSRKEKELKQKVLTIKRKYCRDHFVSTKQNYLETLSQATELDDKIVLLSQKIAKLGQLKQKCQAMLKISSFGVEQDKNELDKWCQQLYLRFKNKYNAATSFFNNDEVALAKIRVDLIESPYLRCQDEQMQGRFKRLLRVLEEEL